MNKGKPVASYSPDRQIQSMDKPLFSRRIVYVVAAGICGIWSCKIKKSLFGNPDTLQFFFSNVYLEFMPKHSKHIMYALRFRFGKQRQVFCV